MMTVFQKERTVITEEDGIEEGDCYVSVFHFSIMSITRTYEDSLLEVLYVLVCDV